MKKISYIYFILFFTLILLLMVCCDQSTLNSSIDDVTNNNSNESDEDDDDDDDDDDYNYLIIGGGIIHGNGSIIDHTCTDINYIPTTAINNAKSALHIAYGHTSHGSQLTDGMSDLDVFKGGTGLYSWNNGPMAGSLDIRDYAMPGDLGGDWSTATSDYLGTPDVNGRGSNQPDINIIIWSWCGQASEKTEVTMLNDYLIPMNQLETEYPGVIFVYMTGHLDGTGLEGNLHQRNEQIRNFCRTNNKWLYDFADIETYNPDGTYFGNLYPDDNCDYDSDGSLPRTETGNWAIEWQNNHPGEWYSCGAAHTQPLNANRKAYAAWWLWARIAGWNGNP